MSVKVVESNRSSTVLLVATAHTYAAKSTHARRVGRLSGNTMRSVGQIALLNKPKITVQITTWTGKNAEYQNNWCNYTVTILDESKHGCRAKVTGAQARYPMRKADAEREVGVVLWLNREAIRERLRELPEGVS